MATLVILHHPHNPLKENYLTRLVSKIETDQGLAILYHYFSKTQDIALIEEVAKRVPKLQKWTLFLLKSLKHALKTSFNLNDFQNEEERFFLGFLHSSTKRQEIERLFRVYCPGKDFELSVFGWLKLLLNNKALGFKLNETAFDIFTLLFRGHQEDEICKKLSRGYNEKHRKTFQKTSVIAVTNCALTNYFTLSFQMQSSRRTKQ